MFVVERRIEWGECDAAGIVFYPNYFRWMDAAFHAFGRKLGVSQRDLVARGYLGTPLVEAGCRFVSPARYDDLMEIGVEVASVGRSSLRLVYRFAVDGRATAEGHEARAFVAETEAGLVAREMPEEIRAALSAELR